MKKINNDHSIDGIMHIAIMIKEISTWEFLFKELQAKLKRLRDQDVKNKHSLIRIFSINKNEEISIVYPNYSKLIVEEYGLLDKMCFDNLENPQFLLPDVKIKLFDHNDISYDTIPSIINDNDELDRLVCQDISDFRKMIKHKTSVRKQYVFALNSEVEAVMIENAIHNQLIGMKDYIEDNIILSTSYNNNIQNSQVKRLKQVIGCEYVITLTIFESSSIDIIITGFETDSFFSDGPGIKEIKVTAKTVAK